MYLIALGIIAPRHVSFPLGRILCRSPQLVSSSLWYSSAAHIVKLMGAFRLTTSRISHLFGDGLEGVFLANVLIGSLSRTMPPGDG